MESLKAFIPIALTLPATCAFLWAANWVLLRRHADLGNEGKFPRQLAMLGLTIAGIIVIAMALPVGVSTRNQVIAFMGLVVSGIFAFSSTTVFANIMAGLMMRVTQPFRTGDFIKVSDFFGRVSERGLLDTEIQTESRQLISIPNTYLISHPVAVIRSSGTIVSVALSLGYDVHHSRVTPLLKEAAEASGLEEPFVHITDLGDFSVQYKVHGLLKDIKGVLRARSTLSEQILDTLHRANIEIVSPGFMNQRPLKDGTVFIPVPGQEVIAKPEKSAEEIVFDKAEEAEKREIRQLTLKGELQALEASLKEAGDSSRETIEAQISQKRAELEQLEKMKPEENSSKSL